ncbi:hypothetical protein BDZ94DRAFT_1235234 [Collybia nuda]|uniref:Uncharacterized protein n=1 Tax=Collybia nuda TaxID=64659 RepID=A0A9P5Y899_9AGAR|nr:hypothetical protein BDZ94DRAFT_1235234 [Collybia nuda]
MPSRGAIIGGILGGIAFIVLAYGLFVLYTRHKNGRNTKAHRHNFVRRDEEASPIGSTVPIRSLFYNRSAYDTTAYPLVHDYSHRPLEGKQERLERIQREMEETQERRDILEMRRSDGAINGGLVYHGGDSEVEKLRRRIEQMSRRIGELELERPEDLPPNYYAYIGDR